MLWTPIEDNEMIMYIRNLGKTNHRFNPPHTSLHVGMIQGGIAPNVIADKCTFYWDVRVIPEDKVQDIIDQFYDYCSELEQELKKKFEGTQDNLKKLINENIS